MATTETFTAANGTQVSALTGWAKNTTYDFDVQSNRAQPDGSGAELCNYQTDVRSNNQYAQVTVVSLAGVAYVGPAVRCATDAATYYGFYGAAGAGSYLHKSVGGVWTQLGSTGAAFVNSDVIYLEADGTTITPKIDGAELDPPGAVTDDSIASGKAGICGYGDGDQIDDWEGGDLGGGGTAYQQAVSGAMTPAGTVVNKTKKALAGAQTFAGVVANKTKKAVAGALTLAGVVANKVKLPLAGEFTPSGVVVGKAKKALAGAQTFGGALTLKTSKAVAGALTTAGALQNRIAKALAGAIALDGALARKTAKPVSGALTPDGTVARAVGKAVAGTLTTAGTVARATKKALAGAWSGAGDLATQITHGVMNYTQAVGGTFTAAGALTRKTAKGLAGAWSAIGALVASWRVPTTVTVSDAAAYGAAISDAAVYGAAASDAAVYAVAVSDS